MHVEIAVEIVKEFGKVTNSYKFNSNDIIITNWNNDNSKFYLFCEYFFGHILSVILMCFQNVWNFDKCP